MARLKPLGHDPKEERPHTLTLTMSKELFEQFMKEKQRVGAPSNSELLRLIIEEYFREEL